MTEPAEHWRPDHQQAGGAAAGDPDRGHASAQTAGGAREDASSRGRTTGQLLRDRTFGPYLFGKLATASGVWIQNLAAALFMYELTGSAFMVGAVSVMQFAGMLLLSLWAGALTDRYDRRKMLLFGRVLSGVTVGGLAAMVALLGVDDFGGPPALLVAVTLMGVGLALSAPAMNALVPALVPDRDLMQAVALASAAPSMARMIGPGLGAALLVIGGPALAFAAAGLAHSTFAVLLVFIRARPATRPKRRPRLLGGVRYLLRDASAGRLMLGVAALSLGADAAMTLTPPLADHFGGGSALVGVITTSFGIGAVLLTLLMRRLRLRLSLRALGVAGFWVLGAGMLASAAATTVAAVVAGYFVIGVGFMTASVALNTRIQRRVPDQLRGRVMALWSVAFLGSRPFAALLNGSIADLLSVQAALVVSAAITLAASVLARARYADDTSGPNETEPARDPAE